MLLLLLLITLLLLMMIKKIMIIIIEFAPITVKITMVKIVIELALVPLPRCRRAARPALARPAAAVERRRGATPLRDSDVTRTRPRKDDGPDAGSPCARGSGWSVGPVSPGMKRPCFTQDEAALFQPG